MLHKELLFQSDVATFHHLTNAASSESSKIFQMIQMCDYRTCPITHLRKGSHIPSGSVLFTPFHCVTMVNKGNVQLPALSHCCSSKNMSWTAFSQELPNTQPSIHSSFLSSCRLQIVSGNINTINNHFLHETFSNCRTQKHLTQFTTHVL